MDSIVKMGVKQNERDLPQNVPGTAGQEKSSRSQGRPAFSYTQPEEALPAAAEESLRSDAAGSLTESAPAEAGPKAQADVRIEEKKEDLFAQECLKQRILRRRCILISKYVIATVVLSYILIRAAGNLNSIIEATGRLVSMIGMLLQPLFWGFVLSYILLPLVALCERRLRSVPYFRKRAAKNHTPAVAITLILVVLLLGLLLSVVVSAITHSLRVASLADLIAMVESFAASLQSLTQTLMARLADFNISSAEVNNAIRQLGEKAAKFTGGISSGLAGAVSHIGGFLTSALFAIIFAIYFLLDGKSLIRYWNRVLLAVGGKKVYRDFHILTKDADAVFSGYIRGQLIDAVIMAVLVSASLYLIGIPYAVIIGVLSGIGNLIPYVGPIVAYGSTILVCLLTGDIRRLLVAVVVLFVIQTVDGNVINPRLLSSSVDVHPMLVIASLIVGGSVGGLVGMLFAVPVAAFLKIQFDRIIDFLLKKRLPEKVKKTPKKRKASKSRPARPASGDSQNKKQKQS